MDQTSMYCARIRELVEKFAREIHPIWKYIHENPETGYEEINASSKLAAWLNAHGFNVRREVAGMSTAFLAASGEGSPRVVFLAEYDALPDIGHACGHSLSGIASVLAGTALAALGCSGTVLVMGTPAEEGIVLNAGGKLRLVEAGFFKDVDAVMMAHAAAKTVLEVPVLARAVLEAEWLGKAAHAGAEPEKGRNAVNALVVGLNACNALYQQLGNDCRLNAVIRAGGSLVNTIPDYAAASLQLRAPARNRLEEMIERVTDCLRAGGMTMGCETKIFFPSRPVADLRHDKALLEIYASALEWLGVKFQQMDRSMAISTDAGDVSHVAPLIHPFFGINSSDIPILHSRAFAEACTTDTAYHSMTLAATALAITGFKVLTGCGLKPELPAKPGSETASALAVKHGVHNGI